jgi:hypothetical protein
VQNVVKIVKNKKLIGFDENRAVLKNSKYRSSMPASTLGIGSEHMFLQCGRSVSMPASQKPFFNALLYRALLYHSSMWTPRHVVHLPPAHRRLPG